MHVRYSCLTADDKVRVTHDGDGQVTIGLVKNLLQFGYYDFYLCGPRPFMESLYTGLIGTGIQSERIHYESWSRHRAKARDSVGSGSNGGHASDGVTQVRFAKSALDATWSREKGTLLELAEAAGLALAFGCRSGICGTCKTKISSGAVDYLEEPLAGCGAGEVLLCCSAPRQAPGRQLDSHEPDLPLDL